MIRLNTLAAAALLLGTPALATAADAPGCIELRTVAEVEEHYVDAQGQPAVRLVPAAKVVPGTEVVWTVSATNVCSSAASALSIDSPVPAHMTYVDGSAAATGMAVSYSLDGSRYASPAELTVVEAGGSQRQARADEYRALRFAMTAPLESGKSVSARYRATVE
jgi:uncharacterized repeat protein (TIGR01451 family)